MVYLIHTFIIICVLKVKGRNTSPQTNVIGVWEGYSKIEGKYLMVSKTPRDSLEYGLVG